MTCLWKRCWHGSLRCCADGDDSIIISDVSSLVTTRSFGRISVRIMANVMLQKVSMIPISTAMRRQLRSDRRSKVVQSSNLSILQFPVWANRDLALGPAVLLDSLALICRRTPCWMVPREWHYEGLRKTWTAGNFGLHETGERARKRVGWNACKAQVPVNFDFWVAGCIPRQFLAGSDLLDYNEQLRLLRNFS
jgi:hypothetical protein